MSEKLNDSAEGGEVVPPVFDPNLFPSRHRPWKQWLLDHNPCLLLSTVLMLLGCYLVNGSIEGRDDLVTPLFLLVVINVYELCIIPLGLLLIRRSGGTARDGWWLLMFEALFLVNATFVNVDFRTGWGVPVNVLLFVLACVKAGVIMRGLKIGLSVRAYGFFVMQLALIYGLPIFFSFVQEDGVVSERVMYGLWWVVGLLPLAYDLIARWDDGMRERTGVARWDFVQQVVRRVYLMVPWVLLVMHMRFAHWAHHADFELANLSPVLLGITLATVRLGKESLLRAMCKPLPIAAWVLAFFGGSEQGIWLNGAGLVSAPHLTFAVAAATYGYLLSPLAGLCTLAMVLFGAVLYVSQERILDALAWVWRFVMGLFPRTALAWGVTTIVAAFVLLGVGTVVSLRRTAGKESS